MKNKPKILRITTLPISMNHIMRGQLGYMNERFDVIGVSSYVKKDVDDILNREQIQMYYVEMHRTIHPIKDLIALWNLFWLIKREKPEIVHTHTPKAGLLGMLAAFFNNVPIKLHTVAGMPLEEANGLKKKILLLTERLTYSLANHVYPNSKYLLNFIVDNKLAEKSKLKVLGKGSSNGINLDFFNKNFAGDIEELKTKTKTDLGLKNETFIFSFIGRLAESKGIAELCQAFKSLKLKHPNIQLLLIGPIEQSNSALKTETKSLMNSDLDIIYPGRAEDIRPILALTDCFVFPSHREGFPGVLLQAGAMGVPIVASDIGGNNELIKNGENGLLFQVKNINDLENKMEMILNNNEIRTEFSNKMLLNIQENYANKILWESIELEYKFLLINSGVGS